MEIVWGSTGLGLLVGFGPHEHFCVVYRAGLLQGRRDSGRGWSMRGWQNGLDSKQMEVVELESL